MSCPICNKPENPDFAPFCSKHCKNIDLLKWFNEDYKIPVQIEEEDEIIDLDDDKQAD